MFVVLLCLVGVVGIVGAPHYSYYSHPSHSSALCLLRHYERPAGVRGNLHMRRKGRALF